MTLSGLETVPAWKSHALLLLVTVIPKFVHVNVHLNIVLTAALTVYCGSWRSIKSTPPTESMTKKDAMRFPFVGSGVLLGLFLLLKFLPKDLINTVLLLYFVGLGTLAITATLSPFLTPLFPESLRNKEIKLPRIRIPFIMKESVDLEATVPDVVGGIKSLGICTWYALTKDWLANNVLGTCFSLQGIEHLSLGSVQIGTILLVGLFFYDIFWVFGTPVMVAVAKGIDAPIKLLFPRGIAQGGAPVPLAMLGLGDIVVPGMFVSLILRYDASRNFKTSYFQTAFWSYTAGLLTTITVMNYFKAAQPALLYIVPAVLGAVFVHGLLVGEFNQLWQFSEAAPEIEKKEGEGDGNTNQADKKNE